MRMVLVSHGKAWDSEGVEQIRIPEADLVVLLIGLTHAGHVITNVEIEEGAKE